MKVRYVGPSQQVKSLTDHQIYSIEQEKVHGTNWKIRFFMGLPKMLKI